MTCNFDMKQLSEKENIAKELKFVLLNILRQHIAHRKWFQIAMRMRKTKALSSNIIKGKLYWYHSTSTNKLCAFLFIIHFIQFFKVRKFKSLQLSTYTSRIKTHCQLKRQDFSRVLVQLLTVFDQVLTVIFLLEFLVLTEIF